MLIYCITQCLAKMNPTPAPFKTHISTNICEMENAAPVREFGRFTLTNNLHMLIVENALTPKAG